jgi:hypothetical protein
MGLCTHLFHMKLLLQIYEASVYATKKEQLDLDVLRG